MLACFFTDSENAKFSTVSSQIKQRHTQKFSNKPTKKVSATFLENT